MVSLRKEVLLQICLAGSLARQGL